MEWLGLIFEILFLAAGIYLYLFAIGKINSPDSKIQKRMDELRKGNAWWIRLAALALTAIMLVNIVVHIQQMLK